MTKFYDLNASIVIDCEYIIIVLDYEFFSIILYITFLRGD